MDNVSPNLDPGIDPVARIGRLRRAHERFIDSGDTPQGVRSVVADSWRRCRKAGVDAHRNRAPVQMADAELRTHREQHPLAAVLPMFRALLGQTATDARYLMAVIDADARLLWVEGHPVLRRRAEHMNFVEGAAWDEQRAGTNAPGTALATRQAVQIFAAEHFSYVVQPWTCSAAPIRDPHTQEVLGVINVTGGDHLATPSTLALVRATALAAEGELVRLRSAKDAGIWPPVRLDDVGAARLEVMGRDEGILTVGSQQRRLSRRHSEILTLLIQRPNGLTGEQLGIELYGDEVNPITLRAEMVRLRRLLTSEMLESRPYRLRSAMTADFTDVMRLLDEGSVAAALHRYRGPLLPLSQAPGIERTRRRVEQQARAGLIAAADPALLQQWTGTPWGDEDLELWELLVRTAPAGATRSLALAEARRLATEDAGIGPRKTTERGTAQ
jgi:transcriptional regulator of acetoin/glycerol metabolism